jgi:uncharacterized protein
MEFFFCVVGMVLVMEGLPYFGSPEKAKALLKVIAEADNTTLRVIGGAAVMLGLFILYSARGRLGPLSL